MRKFIVMVCFALACGCVSKDKYDKALSEGEASAAAAKSKDGTIATLTAENTKLKADLDAANQAKEKAEKDKSDLEASLGESKKNLEELKKAREAAEARVALFNSLMAKLKSMVDAGELKVVFREGRMVLQLPNDVLFDSGKANLKPGAGKAIKKVADVLASIGSRRFQVAGHTDNEKISKSFFASNWELSTARAIQVVEVLIADGMKPTVLSAAGYGEFDPIAPNNTAAGRSRNRRIEITLQPNIEELVGSAK
ncbi:MAG: OmpA/MotB family protein [Polyangiales bacterium]